jgi:hypothetical protein
MKTLPREPWHGGQICGEQLEYGVVPGRSVFCGEFKKLGSPACKQHDKELREYGVLPKFAEGNALGVRIASCSESWIAFDACDEIVAAERTLFALEERLGFVLSWETEDPDAPEPATVDEIAAWEMS